MHTNPRDTATSWVVWASRNLSHVSVFYKCALLTLFSATLMDRLWRSILYFIWRGCAQSQWGGGAHVNTVSAWSSITN